MEYLKFVLTMMFSPLSWMNLHKYNKEYDEWFVNAIDKHEFKWLNPYVVMIDGKVLWIANYPYSCFHVLEVEKSFSFDGRTVYFTKDPEVVYRPSKFNIYKAEKKLNRI